MTTNVPQQPQPISKDKIVAGIICALLALGFLLSALGINTSPGNCSNQSKRILNGKASTEDARQYYANC